MTQVNKLILPWANPNTWNGIRDKIQDPLKSIVGMDLVITSITKDKAFKPRMMTELFNKYYRSEYKDLIPASHFTEVLLPWMQKIILAGPQTFRKTNAALLLPGISTNISLNMLETVTLLACAWFSLMDYNYIGRGKYKINQFPQFTFAPIFINENIFALTCLLNYFARAYEMRDTLQSRIMIIERKCMPNQTIPFWMKDIPLVETQIGSGGQIDASYSPIHTVFASKIIGGDLCSGGSITQEELTMFIRPESLVTLLFCAELLPTEAVIVYGCEKMIHWTGFGSSIRAVSKFDEKLTIGECVAAAADSTTSKNKKREKLVEAETVTKTDRMFKHAMIFIDSTTRTSPVAQIVEEFNRDLNKAFVGFCGVHPAGAPIATGNWTNGYNQNSPQAKFIQLLLAATVTGHSLEYYPNGKHIEDEVLPFIDWYMSNGITCVQLYRGYIKFIKTIYRGPNSKISNQNIFEFLMDEC